MSYAQGLQVSPVSVTIEERASILRLANVDERPLTAQVRVFRWLQDDEGDILEATEEVLASPPFVRIAPDSEQVIRLVRFSGEALDMADCERSYRVIVDELPTMVPEQQSGLQYLLRYSVPVFLRDADCTASEPVLDWSIGVSGGNASLNVVNSGEMRAQLARVTYITPDGERIPLNEGLMGYVLAGSHRQFGLTQGISAFVAGGQIEVWVNGAQRLSPVDVVPSTL